MTLTYTKFYRFPKTDFMSEPWIQGVWDSFDAIDALMYGQAAANGTSVWTNSTNYVLGNQAIDPVDASTWVCVTSHTSAASPTTMAQDRAAHPTYWNAIMLSFKVRGQWLNSTAYNPGDMVYDTTAGRNIQAVCATKHVSNAAGTINDDAAYWGFTYNSLSPQTASGIGYSNAVSHLVATNVQAAIDEVVAGSNTSPAMDGIATAGVLQKLSRGDHVHPTDTSRAPIVSPAFTGTPTAPTVASMIDATTKLATTAFVQNAIVNVTGGGSIPPPSGAMPLMDATPGVVGVSPAYTREDHIHPTDTSRYAASNPNGYQTAAQVAAALPVVPAVATTMPLMDGTATIGASGKWADGAHIHPSNTAQVSKAGDTMTGNLIVPKVQIGSVLTMPADSQNIITATSISLPPVGTIGFNNYQNVSAVNKNLVAGYNSCIYQDSAGGVNIAISPSGAAGASPTFNQSCKLDLGGLFAIKNTLPGGNAGLVLDAAAASLIQGGKGGLVRWQMFLSDGTPESGGNVGSDFRLYRMNDAGATIDNPLVINRSTGIVNVNNLNATTDITSQGTIHCGGNIGLFVGSVSGGGYTVSRGWTLDSGGGATFNMQAYSQPGIRLAAILYYQGTELCNWAYNGRYTIAEKGYQPGGGTWGDTSDARIKTVNGDYTHGLAEIEQLKPVRYKFKGNDTHGAPLNANPGKELPAGVKEDDPVVVPYPNSPHYKPAKEAKEFIGLIAQDCEAILPELITLENGTIDGVEVTDLRQLDQGPLVFALVNAVKELSARVKALESPPLP